MKVIAGRPQDIEDAKALIQILHITNAQEMFPLIAKYTKQEKLPVRVQYIIEDLFAVEN